MTPLLTSCVTMTPPSDSAGTGNGHSPEGSGWSGFWNVSKTLAKSFHPDFDPGQQTDLPDGPWIQLKIQPKELALRLAQKAIPADSYFNTINQVAMACLALASLPGCGAQTAQDRHPEPSKESPGTAASTSQPTSSATPTPTPTPTQSSSQLASSMASSSAPTSSELTSSAAPTLSRSSSQLASSMASSSAQATSGLTSSATPPLSSSQLESTFTSSLDSTISELTSSATPSSALLSSQRESTITSSSDSTISQLTSSATPTATLSSSRLASAPASSPTLTTSELSGSAVSPTTSSISQPASSVTIPPGCRGEPIPVQSSADLARIGKEQGYLPNCNYTQTDNFDAGDHSPISDFTGQYRGNGKRISNLNDCLFSEVQDKGIVRDVVVKNARIEINDQGFTGCKGFIACKSSGHSLLKNNTVEDSHVKLVRGGEGVKLGMLAGEISDHAKLEDNQVRNSTMSADASLFARVGILNGEARGAASLESNSIDGCRITAGHNSTDAEMFTGLMAGQILDGVAVRNSRLTNNQLADNTTNIYAGGIAGFAEGATIEGTHAINNTLLAHMDDAHGLNIAVVVGDALKCRISDTIATNNYLRSEGRPSTSSLGTNGAFTGIVTANCHLSTIKNTLAEHSELYSRGQAGVATAHVSSDCEIHNTTAINMIIEASPIANGEHAAAIAAGHIANPPKSNKISQTTAIGCQISANGTKGYAAVGAGLIKGSVIISDTTACNSTIKGDHVGIATGSTDLPSTRTYACNTKLNTLPDNSGCAEANCLQDPQESTDVPPTRLTTTAGGNQTTTDVLYPHPETLVNSTATKTATLSSSRLASAPASSPTLTTESSDVSTTAYSDQATTEFLSSPLSSPLATPVNSTATPIATGSPDSPNFPPSAKTSFPVSPSSSQLTSPMAFSPSLTVSPSASSATPAAKLSSSQVENAVISSSSPIIPELTSSATPSPVLSRSSSQQERTLTTSLSPTTSELPSSATQMTALPSSRPTSALAFLPSSAVSQSASTAMPSSSASSSQLTSAMAFSPSSTVSQSASSALPSSSASSSQPTSPMISSPSSAVSQSESSAMPTSALPSSKLASSLASSSASTVSPLTSSATPSPVLSRSSSPQERTLTTSLSPTTSELPGSATQMTALPSSRPTSALASLPSSAVSPSASTAMPSSSASSSQLTSPMAFLPFSTATPLASTATPSSSMSSSQLPSSPASSSTQTTSESSSSAVAPATYPTSPTSPPTSPTTIPPGCRGEQIPVHSHADLAKIGIDRCYPPSGKYEQKVNIDAGNEHTPIKDFTGEYNGNNKRIRNLNNCLFQNLKGEVRNLVIKDSRIERSGKPGGPQMEPGYATAAKKDALAFIACTMEQQASQKNNTVQHSNIKITATPTDDIERDRPTHLQNRQVGMLAGEVKGEASLKGNRIEDSTIDIAGAGINAGMVTGEASGTSVIDSNDIDGCNVVISGQFTGYLSITVFKIRGLKWDEKKWGTNINAGLVAGKISGNAPGKVIVSKSTLTGSTLETFGKYKKIWAANGGGVAGKADHAIISDTDAHDNSITLNSMERGHLAVVVADAHNCEIRGTIASNNRLHADGKVQVPNNIYKLNPSLVGVVTAGCFNSEIENTQDINSILVNQGAQNFRPSPDDGGHAAVAAAFSNGCTIRNTTATGTRIETNGQIGSVAIAVAFNYQGTEVSQTTAIDCQLLAIGPGRDGRNTLGNAAVAVAVGRHGDFGGISDTTACNSHIKGFHTGIAAGDPARIFPDTVACNTNLASLRDNRIRLENSSCTEESCPNQSTDAPPTRLTTTAITAGTIGYHTTTDALSPTHETWDNSKVTRTTTGSPDYPDDSPSVKTITATQLQPLPSATVSSSLVNGTDPAALLNDDEVDAGIPVPVLAGGVLAGILAGGIMLYAGCQWYRGYQQGLKGTDLALWPITSIKEAMCGHAPAGNKRDSLELVSLRAVDD